MKSEKGRDTVAKELVNQEQVKHQNLANIRMSGLELYNLMLQ